MVCVRSTVWATHSYIENVDLGHVLYGIQPLHHSDACILHSTPL